MTTKTKRKTLLWILSASIILTSCLFETSKQRQQEFGSTEENTREGLRSPLFSESSPPVFWYSGKDIPGTITLNSNIETVVYLRGKDIHRYLDHENRHLGEYCLVVSFNHSSLKRQLRFRGIPIVLNHSNAKERIFRIDLPMAQENRQTCHGEAYQYAGDVPLENTDSNTHPYYIGYHPSELCLTCHGIKKSSKISLYRVSTNQNGGITRELEVPLSLLDINSLGMGVDMQNQSSNPNQTCSQSSCRAKNFDCCLEGQCTNDGGLRPKAQEFYPEDFAQASQEMSKNPRSFMDYPHIFFVCPQSIPPKKKNPTPVNPQEEEQARFERLRLDYLCLQSTPNYSLGQCSDPTKDTPTRCRNSGNLWTYYCQVGTCNLANYHSRENCESAGGLWSDIFTGSKKENGTEDAYLTVKRDVWKRCGCKTTESLRPQCPDYGLKAKKKPDTGEIIEITCQIPTPPSHAPLQYLNFPVPSRSAPHRLFKDEDGNIEGERFYYLDEYYKSEPQNVAFNMNAILGQFSVELGQAQPAKILQVNSGDLYIIRVTGGTYTPCPRCLPDEWMSNFFPYPPSQNGLGVQPFGYIHNRSKFQNNSGLGNYEDAIFGRACYVPPTMLPFSHRGLEDVSKQRRTRLKTQAAMYMNGYQRDWFGFNQGALIGSFDGVTWFSIGNGRMIHAKSDQLFLAVNAPFADLAAPSTITVDVVSDESGLETVSIHDYDPSLSLDSPEQNLGASCQAWHQCKVDSDCVTKLGWEYVCADIKPYQTHWPRFNSKGEELVRTQQTQRIFSKILQRGLPDGSTKRCVYRGSGAPCKEDVTRDLDEKKQKLFRCAPNFYCADLRQARFNDELVRVPDIIDQFLYGQERDILGRPLRYVDANNVLPQDVVANIESNFSLHTSDLSDVGLCRPGKNLDPANLLNQHTKRDPPPQRADYINQISSCDSSASGTNRVATCPIFQTREDADEPVGDYIVDRFELTMRHEQNMCGNEIRRGASFENTFKDIEKKRMSFLRRIDIPSLAEDGCLRRGMAVCHTDLDCTPNRLHAENVDYLGKEAFGNTYAETQYWKEYLVCSQAHEFSSPRHPLFDKHDVTKNRCCRPLGETITMFTQDDDQIIPDNPQEDAGILDTLYYPYDFTTVRPMGFYSRYIVAQARQRTGPITIPYPERPSVESATLPKSFQWKAIADTGKKTCCGGGMIRKFADNSNNWTISSRLTLDPLNFSCLNYQNELFLRALIGADEDNYIKDHHKLCLAPGDRGCIQVPIRDPKGFDIVNPTPITKTVAGLNTAPQRDGTSDNLNQIKSSLVPYMPTPYPNRVPIDPEDLHAPYNYFDSPDDYSALSIYLPSYIGGTQNIRGVYIDYYNEENRLIRSSGPLILAGAAACAAATSTNPLYHTSPPIRVFPLNSYCITYDPTSIYQILHARAHPTIPADWSYAGLRINFNIPGTTSYNPNNILGMQAGNDLYYLTKLGRLELLGIPQIWYEPIYCNSNQANLVEGIYSAIDRSDFEGAADSFSYSSSINGVDLIDLYNTSSPRTDISNTTQQITFQGGIDLPTIFSGNQFLCCQKLGEITLEASKCCSGYAIKRPREGEGDAEDELVCKLPPRTNLNVYFNRFVSNEGVGEKQPGGGLIDEDFVPETGEPKLQQSVYDKLIALGKEYCSTQTIRRGAAFGFFPAEPNNGYYIQYNTNEEDYLFYSIVDSLNDNDSDNENGYYQFQEGYRWNHHIYCDTTKS